MSTVAIGPRGPRERRALVALSSARTDLERRMSQRETLAVERLPDPMDEAVRLAERDQAARDVDADTAMLHAITEALQRIDAGTWGVCEDCGDRIGQARLKALPWAARCVECQTKAEAA